MIGNNNSKMSPMHSNENSVHNCCNAPHHITGVPLITIKNVSMGWDRRLALNDVSLTVCQGDFIAITGPNGGGKTTLLRLLLGLIKPMSGTVTRNDKSLTIGYLPQKNMIDSQFPISVKEVIKSGLLGTRGIDKYEQEKRYEQTLKAMGLEQQADRAIGELSGGQLQRALLGRAIISQPDLLVLDEPLSYIDKRFEARLYDTIRDIAQTTTIVLVSHEMSTIAGMANRHFIVDGTLHECTAHHHFVYTDCQD